mmetsp:Transcript_87010/g.224012  ORF Transcript_87010/g.224012 Transcript_87010/m.224012 type:complete len:233 (+) Transcript_87010:120-818(+)
MSLLPARLDVGEPVTSVRSSTIFWILSLAALASMMVCARSSGRGASFARSRMKSKLLSQSLQMSMPMVEGSPPTADLAGQHFLLPRKATHQISTSTCAASAKPPARNMPTWASSSLFIVPSGNQPAMFPARTCSSSSCWRTAIRSLSSSKLVLSAAEALKGTARCRIAVTMVLRMGILKRWEDTNIFTLCTCATGKNATSSSVSRKELWLAMTTAGLPEDPSVLRNVESPWT